MRMATFTIQTLGYFLKQVSADGDRSASSQLSEAQRNVQTAEVVYRKCLEHLSFLRFSLLFPSSSPRFSVYLFFPSLLVPRSPVFRRKE
jgi:hypothetical protein